MNFHYVLHKFSSGNEDTIFASSFICVAFVGVKTECTRLLKSKIVRHRSLHRAAVMPRRTAVKAAGATTTKESDETASKGKTGTQPRNQSFAAKMQMVDDDCDNLVVKVDHATTVSIPKELDQPYCCLGLGPRRRVHDGEAQGVLLRLDVEDFLALFDTAADT
eukprot:91089-Pleurochrysis_carterae.AAC.1